MKGDSDCESNPSKSVPSSLVPGPLLSLLRSLFLKRPLISFFTPKIVFQKFISTLDLWLKKINGGEIVDDKLSWLCRGSVLALSVGLLCDH